MSFSKKSKVIAQLDKIVSNVARSEIYVVHEQGSDYNVVNYITAQTRYAVPSKDVADRLAYKLNRKHQLTPRMKDQLREFILQYNKVRTDCSYYRYIIQHVDKADADKKDIVQSRLVMALQVLEKLEVEMVSTLY